MNKSIVALIILLSSVLLVAEETSGKFNGYLRGTYHYHDVKGDRVYLDDAVGGKLHYETAKYKNVSMASSLYAVSQLFNDDNNPFLALRGENSKSYAILGELYVQGNFDKTLLKIGRQELDTPFADRDDVGMVPNTFEAITLVNHDVENLEIYLAQINKMAGVGAEVVDKFTQINANNGMQVLGLTSDAIENVQLELWHNRLKNAEMDSISYLTGSYEKKFDKYGYLFALQYANESYKNAQSAKVWGVKLDVTIPSVGLLFSSAYNSVKDNSANSGFGGGPFFAASEFLLIDNAGKGGSAKNIAIEYDASLIGIPHLTLALNRIEIETSSHQKSSEIDMLLEYNLNEKTDIHMAYIDVEGLNIGEKESKHFHVYINYHF